MQCPESQSCRLVLGLLSLLFVVLLLAGSAPRHSPVPLEIPVARAGLHF